MRNLLLVGLLGVMVLGCGKNNGNGKGSGTESVKSSPCERVADLVAEEISQEFDGESQSAENTKKYREMIRGECQKRLAAAKKEWGAEVHDKMVACITAAKSGDDYHKCAAEEQARGTKAELKLAPLAARKQVQKIYDAAREYYFLPPEEMQTPHFPVPSAGPVPPLGSCCKQGGECQPDPSLWQSPPWTTLEFSIEEPQRYSFAYQVEGNAAPGDASPPLDGSNHFTVYAYGDLDCDGVYSTFSLFGQVDEVYSDGPRGDPEFMVEEEME